MDSRYGDSIMSIQQGLVDGFVTTEIRGHGDERYCHFWLADETGKDSETVGIMDAGDCRNVAGILVERAEELEESRKDGDDE